MSEPTTVIDAAKSVIERMKTSHRQGCGRCQTLTYSRHNISPQFKRPPAHDGAYVVELTDEAVAEGWQLRAGNPGWIKFCDECKSTPSYPWADRLDPERVASFMRSRGRYAFQLSELEKTL